MPPRAAEERLPARDERPSRLRELERADDPTAVVRMDPRRGRRVELAQAACAAPARPRRRAAPTVRALRRRCGRQLELGERGAEVEAGPAHDERCRAGSEHLVDRVVRERRVLAHRRDVREGQMPDQPLRWGERFVRIGRPS
jgi:hypothetical protein